MSVERVLLCVYRELYACILYAYTYLQAAPTRYSRTAWPRYRFVFVCEGRISLEFPQRLVRQIWIQLGIFDKFRALASPLSVNRGCQTCQCNGVPFEHLLFYQTRGGLYSAKTMAVHQMNIRIQRSSRVGRREQARAAPRSRWCTYHRTAAHCIHHER